MAVPLTLDVGLDFDRVLPGEVSPDHAVAERPADAGATARPAAAPPGAAAAARPGRSSSTGAASPIAVGMRLRLSLMLPLAALAALLLPNPAFAYPLTFGPVARNPADRLAALPPDP